MHPFPPADEFQSLVGRTIEVITLGPYQTAFHFEGGSSLVLEDRLCHIEPDGTVWTYDGVAHSGPPLVLHRLVNQVIVSVDRQDLSLTLGLVGGAKLVAYSEICPYESGHFCSADGRILVF
ncbi:MAG: hypothetical protein JWR84_3517 [Caulobacter sp.]|nr:hypothetical protein [Caulobacter sp.]